MKNRWVSREEWGARAPRPGPGPLVPSRVEGLALHWPGMSSRIRTARGVRAALRSWQNFHMDTNGWSDIAYQRAVDQLGNVYRLRGFGTQSAANGDEDVNQRYGALLLVLGPGEPPTDRLIAAVRRCAADWEDRYGHDALHLRAHSAIRPGGGTDCPGDIVRAHLARGTFLPHRRK